MVVYSRGQKKEVVGGGGRQVVILLCLSKNEREKV